MKITYNAPVTLTFAITSVTLFILNIILASSINALIGLHPIFDSNSMRSYTSLFTYVFAHADGTHLFGNMSIILLIGPIVEEKYGKVRLIGMMMITALLTALLNLLLFSKGIIGASGIVFMLIILSSLVNFRRREIPLTFILVALLFVGKEIVDSLKPDSISQFSHIMGGICGSIFGLRYGRKG